MPFHSKKRKWFISPVSVKDEHYAVHKDTKSSQGKCFFFLPSLFSSGVHSILWAHSTSRSRLCLLICGFHITLLQVRAESSCGHRRRARWSIRSPLPSGACLKQLQSAWVHVPARPNLWQIKKQPNHHVFILHWHHAHYSPFSKGKSLCCFLSFNNKYVWDYQSFVNGLTKCILMRNCWLLI